MKGSYVIPVADPISEYSIIFDEPNDGIVIATTVLGIMRENLPDVYNRKKSEDPNAHLGATEE